MNREEIMNSMHQAMIAFGAYELNMEDIDKAAKLSARAFSKSALHSWFMNGQYDFESAALLTACSLKPLIGNARIYSDSPDIHSVICVIPPGFKGTPVFGFLKAGGWKIPYRCGMASLFRMLEYESDATQLRHETDPSDSCVYIYNLAVDPDYQKTGLTHRLLDPLTAWSDVNGVPLYLETNDEWNFSFYEHMGFVKEGIRQIGQGPVYNYAFSCHLPLKEHTNKV